MSVAEITYCSFCGKSNLEALKFIAGPTVFICDECVELCAGIVNETLGFDRIGILFTGKVPMAPEDWKKFELSGSVLIQEAFGVTLTDSDSGLSAQDTVKRLGLVLQRHLAAGIQKAKIEARVTELTRQIEVGVAEVMERLAPVQSEIEELQALLVPVSDTQP